MLNFSDIGSLLKVETIRVERRYTFVYTSLDQLDFAFVRLSVSAFFLLLFIPPRCPILSHFASCISGTPSGHHFHVGLAYSIFDSKSGVKARPCRLGRKQALHMPKWPIPT